MNRKIVALASDHAGFELKETIIKYLKDKGYKVKDFGSFSDEPVDYADFAHPLALFVESDENVIGISICGSGNGINMTVNKHRGIRSALCWNEEISRLAREHNDANICALPGRFMDKDTALKIIDIFLNTEFSGGRHLERINKIPVK